MDEDILKRLQGYNPPDRVITAVERQVALDFQNAAIEIQTLRTKVADLTRQLAEAQAKLSERGIFL